MYDPDEENLAYVVFRNINGHRMYLADISPSLIALWVDEQAAAMFYAHKKIAVRVASTLDELDTCYHVDIETVEPEDIDG